MFVKFAALPLHAPSFTIYQPFYTPSTSRQPVDYAKFFSLSHLKHTPTPAPPKPRSRPTKNQSPPAYHPTPTIPDLALSPELSQESKPTQKNKDPMHQYSSQILPHLSELEENSSSQTEETSTDDDSFTSSDSEKELADVSKLLMVQPSIGSNDPSSSSPS